MIGHDHGLISNKWKFQEFLQARKQIGVEHLWKRKGTNVNQIIGLFPEAVQ